MFHVGHQDGCFRQGFPVSVADGHQALALQNCVCVQQTHGLRESPIETVNLKRDHHELIMIVIQTIVMVANCL